LLLRRRKKTIEEYETFEFIASQNKKIYKLVNSSKFKFRIKEKEMK
jgi:hypothetical protein